MARILVLALDDPCERILRAEFREPVTVVGVRELHDSYPALPRVRDTRSAWAYYATQKPALALFTLRRQPEPESVLHIDADTWFFSDMAPFFEEIGESSVAISPHDLDEPHRHLERYGRYNAGVVYWRNDRTGRRALTDWLEDCLKWCGEEPQADGHFMNQGYLNRWPERYKRVHIVRHPGVNLAPWNIDGRCLTQEGDSLLVNGQPLIFYHFHGLSRTEGGEWVSHFPHLRHNAELAMQAIYRPYLDAVRTESERLKREFGIEGVGSVRTISDWPVAIRF